MVTSIGMWQGVLLQGIASSSMLRDFLVFFTMWMMSLPIRFEQLRDSLQRPYGIMLAIFGNSVIVPALAVAAGMLLPAAESQALMVAAIVPCTIASASVLSRRAGGDLAIPLMTTLLTNGMCFVYVPAMIRLLLGTSTRISFDFWKVVLQLFGLVLLPILLSQLLRLVNQVRRVIERREKWLSMFSQCGILFMLLIGAVHSSIRWGETGASDRWINLGWLMAAVIVVHLAAIGILWWLSRVFRLPLSSRIGVVFAGSQKTLMIGLQLAIDLGVSIFPMVAYHLVQLLIDTMISDRFRGKTK